LTATPVAGPSSSTSAGGFFGSFGSAMVLGSKGSVDHYAYQYTPTNISELSDGAKVQRQRGVTPSTPPPRTTAALGRPPRVTYNLLIRLPQLNSGRNGGWSLGGRSLTAPADYG
jgi:hypothetical protein